MQSVYISIEKYVEGFERFNELWQAHGIRGIHAVSMTEGIEKVIEVENSKKMELLFVDIVADNVDYLPQLKVLDYETDAPILIVTSNPNTAEHHEALNNGADYYAQYCDSPEKDINGVLSVINSQKRRKTKQKSPSQIMVYKDLLVSPEYHKVFVNDKELRVSKNEMVLLKYLIADPGRVLTHKQIRRYILQDEYDQLSSDHLYSIIKRLRSKLREASGQQEYIETIRDVGYRLV